MEWSVLSPWKTILRQGFAKFPLETFTSKALHALNNMTSGSYSLKDISA